MIKRALQSNEKKILYLILIVSLLSFIFVVQFINGSFISNLDSKVNLSIQSIQIPSLVEISKVISYVFDPIVFSLLFIIVVGLLFYKKRNLEAIALAIFTLISVALLEVFKILIHRPRPFDSLITETGFSFPSGHALMALVFFATLIYLFEHHIRSSKTRTWLTILTSLVIILISLSRVYLNVHWFSDIIGSFALGTFIFVAFVLTVNKIHLFRNKN